MKGSGWEGQNSALRVVEPYQEEEEEEDEEENKLESSFHTSKFCTVANRELGS